MQSFNCIKRTVNHLKTKIQVNHFFFLISMPGCSKNNRENYPRKKFQEKKKKPELKFNKI